MATSDGAGVTSVAMRSGLPWEMMERETWLRGKSFRLSQVTSPPSRSRMATAVVVPGSTPTMVRIVSPLSVLFVEYLLYAFRLALADAVHLLQLGLGGGEHVPDRSEVLEKASGELVGDVGQPGDDVLLQLGL